MLPNFTLRSVGLILCIFSFFAASIASAQVSTQQAFEEQIERLQALQAKALKPSLELVQYPNNPAPGTMAFYNIAGSAGIDRATVTWKVNGTTQASGVGMLEFKTQVPSVGKVLTVSVSVVWLDGRSTTAQKVARPAQVDILWQSNSYTPPFYRGKALIAYQSPITFVAVPNIIDASGVRVPDEKLVYTWTEDGSVLPGSGYGKNTITRPGSVILKPFTINVTVSTISNSVAASAELTVGGVQPQTILYSVNSLTGVAYESAISTTLDLPNTELTFRAVPYFYTTSSSGRTLRYEWSMNGQKLVGSVQDPRELTVRQETESGGSARVGVSIENPAALLQFGSTNVTIKLKEASRESGF